MKYLASLFAFFIMSGYALPLSVACLFGLSGGKTESKGADGNQISVYFKEENKVRTMPLEKYIKCVVAAEMPASFEAEALKAQAVAARSFAVCREQSQNPVHPDAAVCTDSAHCKAFRTEEASMQLWGADAERNKKKIDAAVDSTAGEILTYNGETCLAVFHSQSGGGRTESSRDVWGGDKPYLVSVESHGEENAPNYYSSADVPFGEFCEKLKAENPNAVINSPADIGETVLSSGGAVKSIVIGGASFKGSDIRRIFNLRSACFEIKSDESRVHFDVRGYGHGVGMSQYGANTLAKEGKSYKEILFHYYTGTKTVSRQMC